jgi:hypothetical protein
MDNQRLEWRNAKRALTRKHETKNPVTVEAEIHCLHGVGQVGTGQAVVSANSREVNSEECRHLWVSQIQLRPKSLRNTTQFVKIRCEVQNLQRKKWRGKSKEDVKHQVTAESTRKQIRSGMNQGRKTTASNSFMDAEVMFVSISLGTGSTKRASKACRIWLCQCPASFFGPYGSRAKNETFSLIWVIPDATKTAPSALLSW